MIDVLLAHSNFLVNDPKQRRKMRPFPPMGTMYAAALLRRRGFSVALFDATFAAGPDAITAELERHRPRVFVVFEDQLNFISKMCLSAMRDAAREMGRRAQAFGAVTMVAGPDVSTYPHRFLGDPFDLALVGEAEVTLTEVLQAMAGRGVTVREAAPTIAGVWWLEEGRPAHSEPRPPLADLEQLPQPAWDLVEVEDYRRAWVEAHGRFTLGMAASRGCPYTCCWCAKPIWGNQYAARSPASVADEMQLLLGRYSPDHLWFADDIFGLDHRWLRELAAELDRRRLRVPFTIQTRTDVLESEQVELLRRCGCEEAWVGVESGSQRVVDAMGKSHRVDEIPAMVERLQAAGIRACMFLQFGFPGETFDDIMATVSLVHRAMPSDIGISVSYPMPGTRFYESVAKHLRKQDSWHDSGDLTLLFRGEYTSEFYRRIHGLLHRDLACRNRLVQLEEEAAAAELAELEAIVAEWAALERNHLRFRTGWRGGIALDPGAAADTGTDG